MADIEKRGAAPHHKDSGSGIAEFPRITIVVPSFNQGRYIGETLESIVSQGYPNLELMVIDGGSRDETVEVIRKYEADLHYWVSEPDAGQTDAINKGLARATGDIFAYLNSDDLLVEGSLESVAEAFEKNPDADVIHGQCIYISEKGDHLFIRSGRVSDFRSYLRIWERFCDEDFLTQPEVFWRKSLIDQVGPFRTELHSVMDFEMWLRMLEAGAKFTYLDRPVAKFRTYPIQKSSVDPGLELCRVIEEYTASSKSLSSAERKEILDELPLVKAHLLVRAAIAATMIDRYGTALKYCRMAVASKPSILGAYSFWSVLLTPIRRRLPKSARNRIRRNLA